jgi:hypothetical protein
MTNLTNKLIQINIKLMFSDCRTGLQNKKNKVKLPTSGLSNELISN